MLSCRRNLKAKLDRGQWSAPARGPQSTAVLAGCVSRQAPALGLRTDDRRGGVGMDSVNRHDLNIGETGGFE